MILGFDVGGTNARGILFDPADNKTIDEERASSAGSGDQLVATLATIAQALVSRNKVAVTAAGIGIAGLAERSGTVRYSPNLPDLIEFPIGPAVSEALRIPVVVSNDANTGTWAEAKLGAGRGVDHIAFVALGTGIGTGFVVGGQLLEGAHGFAGESGHAVIDFDGPEHHTGQRGPWEYYASGNALGRLGREAGEAGRFASGVAAAGSVGAITGFHVVNAVEQADVEAEAIFDAFCRYVAIGTANLALILDPERVILGGGLANIGEPLRAGVDRWLSEVLLGQQHRPAIDVVLAELGADAGALGAALMAAQRS